MMTDLGIDRIHLTPEAQPRAELDAELTTEYAEAMEAGAIFPPVTVFRDMDGVHWLADGFHRVGAVKVRRARTISADVRPGGLREAILYAAGANGTHGLRRTNADKRRAVTKLLSDREWGQWSNREIARRCAVGRTFVNEIRGSLAAAASEDSGETRRTYRTKHGTVAKMDASKIGKARGREPADATAGTSPRLAREDSRRERELPWSHVSRDLLVIVNSVRDAGGIARITAGWPAEDKRKAANQIELVTTALQDWQRQLRGLKWTGTSQL